MAVPVLGGETRMLGDWNRIYAAEMKYAVKGCTRTDRIRHEDIRNEFDIVPLFGRKKIRG
jgi:hypothetical protein